jgi:Protein of unknown function (DUF674)
VGPRRGNPLYVTDTGWMICSNCRQPMMIEMRFIQLLKADDGESGYVKGLITCLVMDDLSVMPMSTISAFALLKKFQLKDLSMLSEMTIEFGMKEVVDFHHIYLNFISLRVYLDYGMHRSRNNFIRIKGPFGKSRNRFGRVIILKE